MYWRIWFRYAKFWKNHIFSFSKVLSGLILPRIPSSTLEIALLKSKHLMNAPPPGSSDLSSLGLNSVIPPILTIWKNKWCEHGKKNSQETMDKCINDFKPHLQKISAEERKRLKHILPATFIFRLAKFLNLWYSKVFPFLKEVPLENK